MFGTGMPTCRSMFTACARPHLERPVKPRVVEAIGGLHGPVVGPTAVGEQLTKGFVRHGSSLPYAPRHRLRGASVVRFEGFRLIGRISALPGHP